MTANPYLLANRTAKAMALQAVVHRLAADLGRKPSEIARRMNAEERRQACEVARVKPASPDTWAMVIAGLERSEEFAGDPFARFSA